MKKIIAAFLIICFFAPLQPAFSYDGIKVNKKETQEFSLGNCEYDKSPICEYCQSQIKKVKDEIHKNKKAVYYPDYMVYKSENIEKTINLKLTIDKNGNLKKNERYLCSVNFGENKQNCRNSENMKNLAKIISNIKFEPFSEDMAKLTDEITLNGEINIAQYAYVPDNMQRNMMHSNFYASAKIAHIKRYFYMSQEDIGWMLLFITIGIPYYIIRTLPEKFLYYVKELSIFNPDDWYIQYRSMEDAIRNEISPRQSYTNYLAEKRTGFVTNQCINEDKQGQFVLELHKKLKRNKNVDANDFQKYMIKECIPYSKYIQNANKIITDKLKNTDGDEIPNTTLVKLTVKPNGNIKQIIYMGCENYLGVGFRSIRKNDDICIDNIRKFYKTVKFPSFSSNMNSGELTFIVLSNKYERGVKKENTVKCSIPLKY